MEGREWHRALDDNTNYKLNMHGPLVIVRICMNEWIREEEIRFILLQVSFSSLLTE